MTFIDSFDFKTPNGEKVICNLWRDDDRDVEERFHRIQIHYKGGVYEDYYKDEKPIWHAITMKICNIVDILGDKGFEEYKDYKEKLIHIKYSYIIIDDKIYKPEKPYLNKKESGMFKSGNFTYYYMTVKMQDGSTLTGDNPCDQIFEGDPHLTCKLDKYNESISLSHLQKRVSDYHKKNKTLPCQSHLDNEKTSVYLKIKKWCDDNKIKIDVFGK